MKITKRQLRRIIKEEKAKIVTEAPNIPDVMGAIGGGKFQPRHEVIEVVDGEWGDVLFFSDRPVKLSADGPMRKPASDIGDWNALVKDLKLQPEDITDTLIVQEPGHSMYELSHDEFAALELALEKEKNPSLKNVSYTPDPQREGKAMKITKNRLRRIIKEEKAKLLSEQRATGMGQTGKAERLFRARENLLNILDTINPDEAYDYIGDLIKELQMMQREM